MVFVLKPEREQQISKAGVSRVFEMEGNDEKRMRRYVDKEVH